MTYQAYWLTLTCCCVQMKGLVTCCSYNITWLNWQVLLTAWKGYCFVLSWHHEQDTGVSQWQQERVSDILHLQHGYSECHANSIRRLLCNVAMITWAVRLQNMTWGDMIRLEWQIGDMSRLQWQHLTVMLMCCSDNMSKMKWQLTFNCNVAVLQWKHEQFMVTTSNCYADVLWLQHEWNALTINI